LDYLGLDAIAGKHDTLFHDQGRCSTGYIGLESFWYCSSSAGDLPVGDKNNFIKTESNGETYTHELVDRLGTAFFISLLVMVFGNIQTGMHLTGLNFGYLLLLYAFWMFIHGSVFRYQLLIYGAIINWAGAIIIFYFKEKLGAEVLLVHALCVAMGYLVPGHIARIRYGKSDSITSGE
jgi:hypothetical protein